MRPTDPTTVGGRYRLLARLGSGGMGVVYLGRSPGGRLVAVKCVHWDLATDPEFRRRFTRELEAVRRVGGFHTAQVVDADPDGDPPWLVTAYIPGPSLEAAVTAHGPLPEPALRVLGAGLAEALEAIHAAGLVHRDLKPSNVLLSDDGPRVIDFGIARALDGASITRTQVVLGTPGYMAPEQIAGGVVGPACDVFSLGRVLCHAAGCSPWGSGDPQVLLYRIMHSEPDLTGVPEQLRPIVASCLARHPVGRPTPAQLVARLGPPEYDGPTGSWLPEPLRARPAVPEAPWVEPTALPAPPSGLPAVPPAVPPTVGRTPTVLSNVPPPGWATTPQPPVGRRRRRLWMLLPAVLALVAAAVAVPLYLQRDTTDAHSLSNGFVTQTDDGSPPDCVTGGTNANGGGAGPTAEGGLPTAIPTDTPHAPNLTTPADNATLEQGLSLTLSWEKTGAVTRVFTKVGNGDWRASGWLTSNNCTFKPTETGLYQWAVDSSNTSTHGIASGWSNVRYLYVKPKYDTSAISLKGMPTAPRLVFPDDQAVVRAGQPVLLSWAASGTSSQVDVLLPNGKWQQLPWQSGSSYTYTPPTPGTYIWSTFTSDSGSCGGTSSCVSGSSEQRYLIVQ
ncbi:serine/threonine-protein kinase [Kitasatospora aureofaciens]|uniref:serine/threonine protein kinase n=1 Tax=Kitasatospora aureofaciens TaxID=1894 RepID=UPI0021090C66|nr:serine/threonine-protein kinase [Kitasatospora aureofaciens]